MCHLYGFNVFTQIGQFRVSSVPENLEMSENFDAIRKVREFLRNQEKSENLDVSNSFSANLSIIILKFFQGSFLIPP